MIALAVVLVLSAGALGFFLGPDDNVGRAFFSVWVAWVMFCLLALIGVIYVAVHFLQKYW